MTQIVEALTEVDALQPDRVNSLVRHWLIEEVEHRFPSASDAVESAFYASGVLAMGTGDPALGARRR